MSIAQKFQKVQRLNELRNGISLDAAQQDCAKYFLGIAGGETDFDRTSCGCFDLQLNWCCGFKVSFVTRKLLRSIYQL